MISGKIENSNGVTNSILVSTLGNIPTGTFKLTDNKPFLVKNITDENISLELLLANSPNNITTVLYPGWNPELVISVQGATAGLLQYGY